MPVLPPPESDRARKRAALTELTRRHLILAGYTEKDVLGLGDLRKLTFDQKTELFRRKAVEQEVREKRPKVKRGRR